MDIVTLAAAKALAGGGGGGGGGGVLIVTDTDGTLNKTYNEIVAASESKSVKYKWDDADYEMTCLADLFAYATYAATSSYVLMFWAGPKQDAMWFVASSADGYPVKQVMGG